MNQYPDDEDVHSTGASSLVCLQRKIFKLVDILVKLVPQLILCHENCPNAKRVLVDATFAITHFIEDDDNRLMWDRKVQ